jgi:hypothetical protein
MQPAKSFNVFHGQGSNVAVLQHRQPPDSTAKPAEPPASDAVLTPDRDNTDARLRKTNDNTRDHNPARKEASSVLAGAPPRPSPGAIQLMGAIDAYLKSNRVRLKDAMQRFCCSDQSLAGSPTAGGGSQAEGPTVEGPLITGTEGEEGERRPQGSRGDAPARVGLQSESRSVYHSVP